MRLIDADTLLEELKKSCKWHAESSRELSLLQRDINIVKEQPTVDAVHVIRCKDCKYYSCGTVEGKHLCMSVKYRFTPTTEDEWCSRAERKEE